MHYEHRSKSWYLLYMYSYADSDVFRFLDYQRVETRAVVTDKYVAASSLGRQCNYVKVKAEDYEDIVVVDGFAYGNIDEGDLVTITETTYLYGLLTDKSLVTD